MKNFAEILAEAGTDQINEIDLFDEENQHILELAGSLPIIDANHYSLERVEKKLTEVALEVKKFSDQDFEGYNNLVNFTEKIFNRFDYFWHSCHSSNKNYFINFRSRET